MKPQEYVKNVLITEARDFTPLQNRFSQIRNIRLLHGVMGLSSELTEIQELAEKSVIDAVNLKEEMGDFNWYIGVIIDEFKFNPEEIFMFNDLDPIATSTVHEQRSELQNYINGMVKSVGTIADIAKKSIMYGKELDEYNMKDQLQKIDYYISRSLRLFGQTSAGARESNIEKLKARYGEKFTEAAALERNLEVERAILEKK